MGNIVTVCGSISPNQLGVCYPHEHLLTRPPANVIDPDLTIDSEDAAVQELSYFRMAGGQAIVEMTPPDYGRNPEGLKRVSERSGIHVISTTGWLKDKFCKPFVENKSVEELADEMIRDLTQGIGQTGIRAGVIKIATSLNTITTAEEKVIYAAARAACVTGAPIITHTEAGTMALEQVEMLTAQGVKASRICLSHLDRHTHWDEHYAVVSRGANLIYDQISKEKYVPDAQRVELVMRMVNEGFGNQIMLAGDMSRKSYWPAYGTGGGPGLTYILWRFIPWLRSAGLSNEVIDKLMISNPARCLQWAN